jgi:prepilin-type N-terminal cleavage/methylation domain-containing protein
MEARSNAGFSLLEFAMGMTILSIGLLAVAGVVGRTGGAYESSSAHVLHESRMGRAMNRIVQLLGETDATILDPDPTSALGTSDLRYRLPLTLTGGTITWGPLNHLFLEYEPGELNNGLDDDQDGLVDEMQLALVLDEGGPTERKSLVCDGLAELAAGEAANGLDDDGDQMVDEQGFCVRRIGDLLLIELSGQGVARGEDPFDVELSMRITLRN